MDCERWGLLLSRYMDSELAGSDVSLVEKHLEGCSTCREELESYRELSNMLCARTEPDPFFVSRFRARKDEVLGQDASWLFWKRVAVRLLPLATAAMLAAVALMLLSPADSGLEELETMALGDGIIVIAEEEPPRMLELAFESLPGGEQ